MLDFSDYLQNFMKTNSISMVELSKETNIDRTVIYRYVKGTRVPSDMEIVIRIADAMQMSAKEKSILLYEYDKLVFGESMVYSYQYIRKLLWNLNKLDRSSFSVNSQWRATHELKMNKSIIKLGTREEIVTYILDLFQYMAEQHDIQGKLLLIMQPIYDEIQRFLPQIFGKSSVEIEQIVCLEQNVNQGYKNLEVFNEIFPLCFLLTGYDVYYYYDSLGNHINNMTLMPNIIIVQDYVVQFDYEMKNGMVVKSNTYADIMRREYTAMRKQACNLLVRGKRPQVISDFIQQIDLKHGGCFLEQLCMGACLDRNILEKRIYSIPGKEEFIDILLAERITWDEEKQMEMKLGDIEVISYGTCEGVEKFMATGRIKEFPENLYEPLSLEERILVLNRMVVLAKAKKMHYRLISKKIDLPERIQVYWEAKGKRFVLNWVTKEEILQITVDEQSIYRAFQMYLEYLEKKGLICSEEESVNYLVQLQKKYNGIRV